MMFGDKSDPKTVVAFAINPDKKFILEDGTQGPDEFMRLATAVGDVAENIQIVIDGKLQNLTGESWEKNLISTMKKGTMISLRGTIGEDTITRRGPLDGFNECWNVIPEENIFFSDSAPKK